MEKITLDEVKKLEERRIELDQLIEDSCKNIISERDALADKIFEAKRELQHYKEHNVQSAESDIYNVKNILEAGSKKQPDNIRRMISLCYKAYSINPFRDSDKASEVLALLNEYEGITKILDSYYNMKVMKANMMLEKAQKELKEAKEKRLQYRRDVLHATTKIKDAASHDIIGSNELYKHGADAIRSGALFGVANCLMDGCEIIALTKNAINNEQEQAEESRKITSGGEYNAFVNSTWVEGEPFAMFGKVSGVSKNAFSNPLKGLFAK